MIPLTQLQQYLAFGLTCEYTRLRDDTKHLVELKQLGLEFMNGNLNRALHSIKPLVVPMSELTDEQWIEVFCAGLPAFEDIHKAELIVEKSERFISIAYHQWTTRIVMTYGIKYHEFSLTGYTTFNQLAAFQKLFSLHADVYGWISAGSALNKLTYKP